MLLHVLTALQPIDGVPSAIIVLIHGTFASNAEWVRPGSLIHEDIKRDIPNDPLVYSFPWTGRNCARQRELAALALREQLVASVERYPQVPHILVGHSHGGNIALRAISGVSLLESAKVVCLSTPIIYVIPRPHSEKRRAKQSIAKYILLLTGTLSLVGYLSGLRSNLSFFTFLALVIAPISIFATISLERHLAWSLKFCELSFTRMTLAPASILFLRFLGDEASFGLSTFEAFQYALNRLIKLQGEIVGRASKVVDFLQGDRGSLFPRSLGFIAAGAGVGFLLLYLTSFLAKLFTATGHLNIADWLSHDIVKVCAVLVPMFLVLGLMVALLALMVILTVSNAVVCLVMIAVGVFPVGWRLAAASLWTEITVESAPIGSWNLTTLSPANGDDKLRHSLGYQNAEAMVRVVSFIRGFVSTRTNVEAL